MDLPPQLWPNQPARKAEALSAIAVVVSHTSIWSVAVGSIPFSEGSLAGHIASVLFWGTPVLLGTTTIVAAAVDGTGLGSVLSAGWALVVLFVVGRSVSTMLYPPEGGGVFFGHMLTTAVVVPLVGVVAFRPLLDRFSLRLWRRLGDGPS